MLSGKNSYSRNVHIQEKQAIKDKKLRKEIANCKRRYNLHKKDMRPVNLDDVINKYAPGAKMYIDGYKTKFSNGISDYIIYTDPAGYLRVKNLINNKYIDILTNVQIFKSEKQYNELTHFKIRHRGEL